MVSRNIWWIFDEFLKMFKGVNLGSNLKNAIEIQRTTVLSTWRCFKPKETRLHKPSLSWQAIANLLVFCVLRLPWSPGTSWQPLWAVSYAPSALQTDILPRSRVGDRHSPCHAMMSSEVRAASIRKKRANSQSPVMRDLVYEVESPWVWSSAAV